MGKDLKMVAVRSLTLCGGRACSKAPRQQPAGLSEGQQGSQLNRGGVNEKGQQEMKAGAMEDSSYPESICRVCEGGEMN